MFGKGIIDLTALRARFHGHDESVADIVRWRQRLDLIADERLHHLWVPLVPPAREHHTFARAHQHICAVHLGAGTDHCPIDDNELAHRRLELHGDTAIEQALEEHGDQRRALGANVLGFAARQLGLQLLGDLGEVLGQHRVRAE